MRIRSLAIVVALGFMDAFAILSAMASPTIQPEAQGSTGWTMDFCKTTNLRACNYLIDSATDLPMSPFQAGQNIGNAGFTSLSSGAITTPAASTMTRPASAISSAVTATSATPCVFTWTATPLVNGQSVVLGGTAVPTGFTAGQAYFVVSKATNTFQLSATFGGTGIASSSTGTAVTAALTYISGSLIGNSATAGSVTVPSFAIATSGGGAIIPRIRVFTNVTSGWDGATVTVTLWSAAPTYTNGDGQPYAATGSANWLAKFIVSLNQFNDGAAGGAGLTSANQAAIHLASGTTVYADIQAGSQNAPIASQTFNVVPELLN